MGYKILSKKELCPNQYELVIDKLPKTIQELKDGLAKNK